MIEQPYRWSSVPVADTCLDRHLHTWRLINPSLDPFESLWRCLRTGEQLSWADLNCTHGPVEAGWNSRPAATPEDGPVTEGNPR